MDSNKTADFKSWSVATSRDRSTEVPRKRMSQRGCVTDNLTT